MKYLPLFEIVARHPYYIDSRCTDLRIEPGADVERLARDGRLAVKSRPDGILVVAPVDAANKPVPPLLPGAALRFRLRLLDTDFPLFTDMSAVTATPNPVYTNAGNASPGSGGALKLISRPGEAVARALSADGLLAGVEITDVDALQPSHEPARFLIELEPFRTKWVYYVVSDAQTAPGATFEIFDGGPAAIHFSAAGARDLLSQPDASDPVAAALTAKYPGAPRLLRFVSDELIASSQKPRASLELRVDGNPVVERLPNPSIRSYARIDVGGGEEAARRGSFFCVVEHMRGQLSASI